MPTSKLSVISERLALENLEQRVKAAESALDSSEEKVKELQKRLEIALAVRLNSRNVKVQKTSVRGKGDVTAVLVASDWHLEETVDPGTVGGLNEFNLAIAAKRADRFFRRSLFLASGFSKFLNLNRVVLALLGDLITGHLHEENLENNSLSPSEAITFAFERIRAGVRLLLAESPAQGLDIICASGNHGRTINKPRASTRTKHSFENLLYQFLLREFSADPRVRFVIEEGYHVWHEVSGHQIRFHHGDAIKYQGGVGGLYIPVGKAISQWNRARPAYLDVFGHWHQNLDGGSFVCNGSLIGYNAYGVAIKASYEKPQQQFFLMDREHGKIATLPIFVEG